MLGSFKKVHGRALLVRMGILVVFLCSSAPALADDADSTKDPKARLSNQSSGSLSNYKIAPVSLRGGSQLTIVSPQRWHDIGLQLLGSLKSTHETFTKIFGEIPRFESSVRLMDEDTFYLTTGAPRWTNAMYYRGEIIIPLSFTEKTDFTNVYRSLRHEYMHAVVHALSGGKCPGWLDEGLAQWSEGDENPALQPALYNWLRNHNPVSLGLLQGGFTKLDNAMVPASYAQSLFSANTVINTFGFSPIRHYFDALREGEPKAEAFKQAFNLSEGEFEVKLGTALTQWSNSFEKEAHENSQG